MLVATSCLLGGGRHQQGIKQAGRAAIDVWDVCAEVVACERAAQLKELPTLLHGSPVSRTACRTVLTSMPQRPQRPAASSSPGYFAYVFVAFLLFPTAALEFQLSVRRVQVFVLVILPFAPGAPFAQHPFPLLYPQHSAVLHRPPRPPRPVEDLPARAMLSRSNASLARKPATAVACRRSCRVAAREACVVPPAQLGNENSLCCAWNVTMQLLAGFTEIKQLLLDNISSTYRPTGGESWSVFLLVQVSWRSRLAVDRTKQLLSCSLLLCATTDG